jgi:hypothetical protein
MSLPALSTNGFLPPGVHQATQDEIAQRFGINTPRRQVLMNRLRHLLTLARSTGQLRRAFVWGSFVTEKSFPRDLDLLLLMAKEFDRQFTSLPAIQRSVFEHEHARLLFEADVFWATEAIGEEELSSWLSVYQFSREMVHCGIVEVIFDD